MLPTSVEGLRATRYRQRLAALLRSPICRSISFAIGAAPIHRNFFAETAAAIEGVATGATRKWNGQPHRQVQYGVHLLIDDTATRAGHDADADMLTVPPEAAFDTLDGRAELLRACVHVGLNLEGRNLDLADSECAARIAAQLFRMFETLTDSDLDSEVAAKLEKLEPELAPDKAFFRVAAETLRHLRGTSLSKMQARHAVAPGSFMRIISMAQRDMLHAALLQAAGRKKPAPAKPRYSAAKRPSRFLALQAMDGLAAVGPERTEKAKIALPRVPLLGDKPFGDKKDEIETKKVVAFAQ
jgi:hypothetical protein